MQPPTEPILFSAEGAQTLREVATTQAALLAATTRAPLVLDCTRVTEADLSFVQLILAAARGDGVAVRAQAGGALAAVLSRGGFRLEPDGQVPANPRLWCATA